MAKSSNVSRINEAYIEQHDAYVRRQKQRKKRLIRRLALFGLVVMITMVCLTTYHIKQRAKLSDLQAEYEEKSDELVTLEKEEKKLTQEIKLLNDEEYLLQIAKTNYFFTEEGEIVFKLPEEESSY